ncbi:MAG: PH domain-containing protein [Gammaproteobacteria bacterium]
MKAIDKILLPDEQILYRTKKHLIIFFLPIIWTIVTFIFLFNPNPLIVKISFAPAIAAVVTWIKQWLDYITSEFVLTNKRIIMKEGFFIRHSNEMRLATVSNMTINQGILGQMLDYGTVVINPFGGNNDVFSEIEHPYEFQKQTQMELDKVVK